jgi:hypothetical protein
MGNTSMCGWWQQPGCAAAVPADPDVKLTTYTLDPASQAPAGPAPATDTEGTEETATAAAATPYAVLALANFGPQVHNSPGPWGHFRAPLYTPLVSLRTKRDRAA